LQSRYGVVMGFAGMVFSQGGLKACGAEGVRRRL